MGDITYSQPNLTRSFYIFVIICVWLVTNWHNIDGLDTTIKMVDPYKKMAACSDYIVLNWHHQMQMKVNYQLINKLQTLSSSIVYPFIWTGILQSPGNRSLPGDEENKIFSSNHCKPRCNTVYFGTCIFLLSYACLTLMWMCKKDKGMNISPERIYDSTKIYKFTACATSMMNIKAEREMAAIFTNDGVSESYSWIFKFRPRNLSTDMSVYPSLLRTDLMRLQSFSRICNSKDPSSFSYVKFAAAGFSLLEKDLQVRCQGCGKFESISNITSSPTDEKYHMPGCRFVKLKDCNDQQERNLDSSSFSISQDSASGVAANYLPSEEIFQYTGSPQVMSEKTAATSSGEVCQDTSDIEIDAVADMSQAFQESSPFTSPKSKEHQELNENFAIESHSESQISSLDRRNSVRQATQTSLSASVVQPQADNNRPKELEVSDIRRRTDRPSSDSSGYSSETSEGSASATQAGNPHSDASSSKDEIADVEIDDSEHFQSEQEFSNHEVQASIENCKKNPGHFAHFPIFTFELDYIPSKVRNPEVLRLLDLISKLTVRIVVGKTSRNRPKLSFVDKEGKYRFGTGIAVVKPDACYSLSNTEYKEHPGKWSAVKKYLQVLRHKGYVFIETNRHLVWDDKEAQNTIVEFFYDNPNRKGIVFAKGISVHHSSIPGEFTSILMCKTSDLSLIKIIAESRNEIEILAKNLPRNIKEGLLKKVFVFGHPHGREKMLSYGDHVMVKYALEKEIRNGQAMTKLVKINNHIQISQHPEDFRKVLLYTADTCDGCTGSPVVLFKKIGSGETEDIVLDMWMHNGVENKHGLNASLMRVLTPDDVKNHGKPNTSMPSVHNDDSTEDDQAANTVISCPVYTVFKPPSYPAYVAYNKRLGSYPVPFNHVHLATDLAEGGFFYAGYGDCVRCFQCGLGLRSWQPGDCIHEEHHKGRADCQFLQMKLREAGIVGLRFDETPMEQDRVHNAAVPNDLRDSTVAILEREQHYLKQILTCKVCCQNPVKDLFLPCGELVACVDCSKLLTHCPSCNTKIAATVTVYFS